jgi:predicted DNA-binding transcriptional regulator AlpA
VHFCRKTIDRWEKEGRFPKRITFGPNCVAWVDVEVEDWMEKLMAGRNRSAVA